MGRQKDWTHFPWHRLNSCKKEVFVLKQLNQIQSPLFVSTTLEYFVYSICIYLYKQSKKLCPSKNSKNHLFLPISLPSPLLPTNCELLLKNIYRKIFTMQKRPSVALLTQHIMPILNPSSHLLKFSHIIKSSTKPNWPFFTPSTTNMPHPPSRLPGN